MSYKSGQWLFLNVPSVSKSQWHPFTITSSPYDPYISLHVRQTGTFTRDLRNALYMQTPPPTIRVDGPYGAPAEDVWENEVAVMVGAGIGVTPWASILKSIRYQHNRVPRRLQRLEFIWICKDTANFAWFQALLRSLEDKFAPGSESKPFLRIHTYLTENVSPDSTINICLNTVGSVVDPVTTLKTACHYGRPNFKLFFREIGQGIVDRTYLDGTEGCLRVEVGVYVCGPSAMAKSIREACEHCTSPLVKFKLRKEHF
jgi:NADPH oxidase